MVGDDLGLGLVNGTQRDRDTADDESELGTISNTKELISFSAPIRCSSGSGGDFSRLIEWNKPSVEEIRKISTWSTSYCIIAKCHHVLLLHFNQFEKR